MAFVRSVHAHARIVSIDVSKALNIYGVEEVITGKEIKEWSRPFVVGVKQPMEHWCLAVDKVLYVGEPIAIVIAQNRYIAEDALELVDVQYEELVSVISISDAIKCDAPVLHEKVNSNIVSSRNFNYGN